MHRILVDEKRWIGEQRFLHALSYCMVLPGPEAQQLAIYIGWLMHRTRGGVLAGGLFVLPGVLSIMALSWAYVLFGRLGLIAGLFYGLKCAVLAIVAQAVVRIGSRALRNATLRWLALAAFVLIFFLAAPFPLIVFGAGLIGYVGTRLGSRSFEVGTGHDQQGALADDADTLIGASLPAHARPSWGKAARHALVWLALWLVPVAALLLLLGPANVFTQLALFFSKMAVVTFGGAYAVLSYVAQQGVQHYHWLTAREMLDGLGMAETTPGPLIMVVQFVAFLGGYRDPGAMPPLLTATLAGLLASWVTFMPCFLWIFLGAPFVERLRGNRALSGALAAITAAVVGVIANLAIWFAVHSLFHRVFAVAEGPIRFDAPILQSVDPVALALSLIAAVLIFRTRLGMVRVLLATSAAGIALNALGVV
jgi:chromate transporter